MYKKLLVSAGGGIVSRDQQAEQANCATVAIGLGGTGIDCLRALKREVYNRVKPDNEEEFVPRYSHIKFLAVDTDKNGLGERGAIDAIDKGTEFFDISYPDIQGLLKDAHNLQQDPALRWLKTETTQGDGSGIKILSATAGAGGVRQIGRLLLLQNCQDFVAKLQSTIEEAQRGLVGGDINIHIYTGLSGGTGAGTFLDVCYILQHVLSMQGIEGRAFVTGFFFLPDVNSANHDLDYLPINGFASMKELDYAMNYEVNGGRWEQEYTGFRISTQTPPVKLAHLVSAKDSSGNVLPDGYSYAMQAVVDYTMEYIIKNTGFTLQSHISNVNNLIGMVDMTAGTSYNYCILGAANTYMPYREIMTYLASKIFEGFKNLNKIIPQDLDVENFVQNNRLKYNEIMKELTKGIHKVPLKEVEADDLYDALQGQEVTDCPGLLKAMSDAPKTISGEIKKNKQALLDTDSAKGLDADSADEISLCARIKRALCSVAADPEKGPYYAAALLSSTNIRDLINHIDGYIEENKGHLDQCNRNMSLREENITKTGEALKNAHGLFAGKKSKAENYVAAWHSYFTEEVKRSQYEFMRDLLTDFKSQITALSDGFFKIFAGMMTELQETFDENLKTLANPVTKSTVYAEPLMTVQELQATLDHTVSEMKIGDQIKRFIESMLDNSDAWVTQDSNRICAAVNNHFLNILNVFGRRSLMYYLQEKYNTQDPATLKVHIYNDIIDNLGKRSAPMFWNESGPVLAATKTMGYLSVPNISDAITGAAQDYITDHAGERIAEREAWSTDRISIFRFTCGMPLFGYKGVSNYLSVYKEKSRKIVGCHLYEETQRDSRDDRLLLDVIPTSRVDPVQWTEAMRTAVEDYDRAVKLGIITSVERGNAGYEYHLNTVDEAVITTWTDEINRVAASGKTAIIKAAVEQARQNLKNLPISSYRIIPNNGASGYEELVVRDHVVDSMVHVATVRKQLAIVGAYVSAIDNAAAGSDKEAQFKSSVKAFTEALETGVIRRDNPYTYSYVTIKYGIEDHSELTNYDKQPYGKDLPLYSAYDAYVALDDTEKKEIAEGVKNILINKSDTIPAVLAGVKESLPSGVINAMINDAKVNHPAVAPTVAQFFQLVNAELDTFSAKNS